MTMPSAPTPGLFTSEAKERVGCVLYSDRVPRGKTCPRAPNEGSDVLAARLVSQSTDRLSTRDLWFLTQPSQVIPEPEQNGDKHLELHRGFTPFPLFSHEKVI